MAQRVKPDEQAVVLRKRLAFRPARLGRNLYLRSPFPPTICGRANEHGEI